MTQQLGNTAESLDYFRKGLEVRERLASADLKNAEAQRDLSVSCSRLGDVTLQMGDSVAALGHYRRSLEIRERLVAADPKNTQAQRDLSISHDKLGQVSLLLGNAAEALMYYRKSLEVRERLAAADPKNTQAQSDLSVSFVKLGNVMLDIGNASSALDYYRKGLEISERLAAADRKNAMAQQDVFINYYKLSQACQQDQQFDEAKIWLSKGLALLRQFQADGTIQSPEQVIGISWSYQKWWDDTNRRLSFCTKAVQSISDLNFALKQPADEIPELLDARLRALAKKGDADGCLATAEAMTKYTNTDANGLYDMACLWSLCAGVAKSHQEECAAKALEHLKKAAAAGYKNVEHMKHDKDLDPLRERADFQKLFAELEANAAKVKKESNE